MPVERKAVEGLLGALVGVVDEVWQRIENAVEELCIQGHNQLVVDQGRIVVRRQVREVKLATIGVLQGDETRLHEVEAAGQHRQRPQLAVRKGAGSGGDLEGHGTDTGRDLEGEAEVGTLAGFDRE